MLLVFISAFIMILGAFSWAAFTSSTLSYQSVTASQQMTQQFLIAEHTLTMAQHWLHQTSSTELPKPVAFCMQQPCIVLGKTADDFPSQPRHWWQDPNNFQVTPISMQIPFSHESFYVIEQLIQSTTATHIYYRITTWSLLTSQIHPTILQSTWLKPHTTHSHSEESQHSWRLWQ